MLYLIRLSVALTSSTTTSSSSPPSSSNTPAAASIDHLLRARTLFRHLATEGPKAKVERGYLLGLGRLCDALSLPPSLASSRVARRC